MLLEDPEQTGTLNHLGVERDSMAEVEAEAARLEAAGLTLRTEGDVVCCYARQDKHWVTGPEGQAWENYVVLADSQPELEGKTFADLSQAGTHQAGSPGACCGTSTTGPASEPLTLGAPAEGGGSCCA